MTTYILKPRIPGGVWVAVVLTVIGAGLIVGSLFIKGSGLRIAGIVVAVLGILFVLVVVIGLRRRRVYVTFDDEGYTIEGPRGEFSASWLDIIDVQVSRNTAKIALVHGSGRRTVISHPARRVDDAFMNVQEGIRQHLEASLTQS